MNRRLIFVLVCGCLLSLFLMAACGNGGSSWTELLTNGGFETGDLTGWTVAYLPGAAGNISVLAATVAPSSGSSVAGPGEGTYYALFDQDENFAGALFQLFTVPDGDNEITLAFDMFVLDLSGDGPLDAGVIAYSGVADNQHTRVDILSSVAGTFDTGGGVIENLYLNVDGDAPILPYISYTVDLSPYLNEGETYMLRFAESSNYGFYMNTGIDNVSIKSR
jgi:hypothetical protein